MLFRSKMLWIFKKLPQFLLELMLLLLPTLEHKSVNHIAAVLFRLPFHPLVVIILSHCETTEYQLQSEHEKIEKVKE